MVAMMGLLLPVGLLVARAPVGEQKRPTMTITHHTTNKPKAFLVIVDVVTRIAASVWDVSREVEGERQLLEAEAESEARRRQKSLGREAVSVRRCVLVTLLL